MVAPLNSAALMSFAATGSEGSISRDAHARVGGLRAEVVQADARATVELSLGRLWNDLSRGLCTVADAFFTEDRCFLVTVPTPGPVAPLVGRRLQVLEAVLLGIGQKRIAIDLGLAPSTIALNARLALAALGMKCRPSRVHPLLMLAALSARLPNVDFAGALSFVQLGSTEFRVVSCERPDLGLAEMLPAAELAVVRSLIEGESYQQIARGRGTSTRTIANQITAVFRRLKVSGRSELLIRLFRGEAVAPISLRSMIVPAPSSAPGVAPLRSIGPTKASGTFPAAAVSHDRRGAALEPEVAASLRG